MLNFYNQYWWKVLAVMLLLFVFIAAFLSPLDAGLLRLTKIEETDSKISLLLIGHQTQFETGDLELAFSNEDHTFCISKIEPLTNDSLIIELGISQLAGPFSYDLQLQNSRDGNMLMRNAYYHAVEVDRVGKCTFLNVDHTKNLFQFPFREILYESVRNLFFHVPMWFAMTVLLIISMIYSISFLVKPSLSKDSVSANSAKVALVFGILGYLTGMLWANYTWGAPIVNDPKLNGAAIAILAYCAYLIMRSSIKDEMQRAKVSTVYNILAATIFMLFIYVVPRITDSLHPGSGGNPAFSQYDLDNRLRMVFYPAVIGWILLAIWISGVLVKYEQLKRAVLNKLDNKFDSEK